MTDDRAAALVLNPRSGALSRLADPAAAIAAALGAAGFRLVLPPAPELPLDAQWEKVLASPARIVFVAGGDGTLRDAAARLRGGDRLLAPLPGGTMNRLCAQLGLPLDPCGAAAAHALSEPGWLDAGLAGEELFLHQFIAGRVTRLMHFREAQRGSGVRGWVPLLCALVRAFGRPPGRTLRVRVAGRRLRGQAVIVTLPAHDGPSRLIVDVARPRGLAGRLRLAWRWLRGRLHEDTEVTALKADRLVIHVRDGALRLSLDGEMVMARPPLRIRRLPRAVPVLLPPR
jgi:diacylglycerol kinase family enzyme